MSKNISFLLLFLWMSAVNFPAFSQQKPDTTYTFRFKQQKDMFYVPWQDNEPELVRLLECVNRNRTDILDGRLPLYVDGYCNSRSSEAENLATAKIRSNRVKTELIIRAGIKEENFVTRNHAAEGDFVTVRLTVPAGKAAASGTEAQEKAEAGRKEAERKAEAGRKEAEHKAEAGRKEAERKAEAGRKEAGKRAEQERLAGEQRKAEEARPAAEKAEAEQAALEPEAEQAEQQQAETPAAGPAEKGTSDGSQLALRANLLRWATLTPDLGLEWRINPSWGVLVNGSWTSWSWNDKDRRYALWEVMPEVRYYIGKEKRGYLGAMFKAGEFNYKLSDTGRQGDLTGGGLTGGYRLRLNSSLMLDFSLALGYLNADYEKYEVIDGVRVFRDSGTKNWWGPVNAGVTLVWIIK